MKTTILTIIGIIVLGCVGYVSNIVKLTECDFKSPYKAEVFRTVGVFVPPIGAIEGFMSIQDGAKQ